MDYSKDVFLTMRTKCFSENANILGGRIVPLIEQHGTETEKYKKSFNAKGHKHNVKEFKEFKWIICNQYGHNAYIGGHGLQRYIYVVPGHKFNLTIRTLLKMLNKLQGLTEFGDYWSKSYKSYLKKTRTKAKFGRLVILVSKHI